MGKLYNNLQNQLKNSETKKDAEKCLQLYEYLKNSDKNGCVWSNEWGFLTHVTFGGFPSNKRTYFPSEIGELVLEGLEARLKNGRNR